MVELDQSCDLVGSHEKTLVNKSEAGVRGVERVDSSQRIVRPIAPE
jgi:hypothetical protein